MNLCRTLVAFCLALVASVPAHAQESARAGRPVRIVLASSKLSSVVEAPLHFKLLRVTVPAGQSVTFAGPSGMLYPISGTLTLAVEGEQRHVPDGEGAFVPGGPRVTLTAGRGASAVVLHYLLLRAADLAATFHAPPTAATELYRTADGIPALKPGPYEFTLTRVSVQPKSPVPPVHHRSGAALYYVLAGSWTIHMQDRREPRARGAVQYEPNGFLHTWENVGDAAGLLLQANISPEGAPEIIFLPRPGQ